ncbi:hypothetical protein [Mesorhizobium australicum]|uniref:Curlin associated repeat-containing protein n=1 Tax=Mesorhizobium australicum TaxID=536018 RepID=A0A1X7PIY7_9HYPH|nr:hypothetical protein [Mesorhizobium australicum]SMH51340.1 hypothetical protein SAMN02982922_4398 [Mesorhizobium australicum]
MNKIILASVALLGLAGVAGAQEVPAFYGVNPYGQTVDASQQTAHSATIIRDQSNSTVPGADGFQINLNQNYSGK